MTNRNQLRSQYLIHFSYTGDRFHGLQPMPHIPTAGGALKQRLSYAAHREPKALCFAARTDSGVHALHNIATCWFAEPFDKQDFLTRLNNHQPDDGLLCVQAQKVHCKVHARGISSSKSYRYVIDDSCQHPIKGQFSCKILPTLNISAMQQAASILIGTHDFNAFRSTKCEKSNSIRTITKISVHGPYPLSTEERQIHIDITGEGFLRHMVRIIAGTLMEVGAEFRTADSIKAVLESKNRRQAGFMAPPQGLTLMRIDWKKNLLSNHVQ